MEQEDSIEVDVIEAVPVARRRGKRSIDDQNKIREANGLPLRKKAVVKRESTAVLPKKRENRAREILARMLQKESKYIVKKILNKALNDDDPDQMACLKIVADRILPVDYFTKEDNKAKAGINIQIMGVGGEAIHIHGTEGASSINDDDTTAPQYLSQSDVIEGNYLEVDDNE